MCSHLGRLVNMRLSVVNVEYLVLSRFEPGYLYHGIQLNNAVFIFCNTFHFFSVLSVCLSLQELLISG
jgi:hypothetical protein